MTTVHWGVVGGERLCDTGEHDEQQRTSVRLVTCQYCRNIIDGFLHDHLDPTLQRMGKRSARPLERKP